MASDAADPREKQRLAEELTDAVAAETPPQQVPVNMYEADAALVGVAPLPAVMGDDVTIDLQPGLLTIRAEMRTAAPKDYLMHEWDYGPYERQVDLPDGFGAGAEATLNNGQLAVRVLRGAPTSQTVQPG